MKFKVGLMIGSCLIWGCAKQDHSQNDQTPTAPISETVRINSFLVNSVNDLPKCEAVQNGALAYIKNEKKFVTCDGSAWDTADIKSESGTSMGVVIADEPAGSNCAAGGKKHIFYQDKNTNGSMDSDEVSLSSAFVCNGMSGLTVTANYLIQPATGNLCTQFSAIESCYFLKGQLVKYSDGSILFGGTYDYVNLAPNYTDTDRNTILGMIPPTHNWFALPLASIARGVGYKPLLLIYNRDPESVSLVYDRDASNTYTAGDEVITVLGLQLLN